MSFEVNDTLWLLVHVGTGYRDWNTVDFCRIKTGKFHLKTGHEGPEGQ